jgi:hypothetical protein
MATCHVKLIVAEFQAPKNQILMCRIVLEAAHRFVSRNESGVHWAVKLHHPFHLDGIASAQSESFQDLAHGTTPISLEDANYGHLVVNSDVNNGLHDNWLKIKYLIIMKHCTLAGELKNKAGANWNRGKELLPVGDCRSHWQLGMNLIDVRNLRPTANLKRGVEV